MNNRSKNILLIIGLAFLLSACGNRDEQLELEQTNVEIGTQLAATSTTTPTLVSTATVTNIPSPHSLATAVSTVLPFNPTAASTIIPTETATVMSSSPTPTYSSTIMPKETATAYATSMPTPLPTVPAVTPTIVSTSIYKPVGNVMPATSRDLLFLADGALKRWNHETQKVEILVPGPDPSTRTRTPENWRDDFIGDIVDLLVSEDGKWAVFSQLKDTKRIMDYQRTDTQSDIYLMDLLNQEIRMLVPQVYNLDYLSLSPDGQYAAFSGSSVDGDFVIDELVMHVYYLATGGGELQTVEQVSQCAETWCWGQILWHPEDDLFVYGGEFALWLYHMATDSSEMLVEHQIPDEFPGGRFYNPIAWANNGRFLLLSSFLSDVVIDVPTRVLVDVPNTYNYGAHFGIDMIWLPDSRLSVLRSNVDSSGDWSTLEIWRFQPEKNEIVKEETVFLSEYDTGAQSLQYLENGRLGYVLIGVDIPIPPDLGLYNLTSLNEAPVRVNSQTFPYYAEDALWVPDGSGALVIFPIFYPGPQFFYYGATGSDELVDITAALGVEPHNFHWQPEIVP